MKEEQLNKRSAYNSRGEELPDSTPMALPVGFSRPKPLGERIRALVENELLNRELAAKGVETFEDADDFDIKEDPTDPTTPYEETFDPLHTTSREQEVRAGYVEERPAERKKKASELIKAAEKAIAEKAASFKKTPKDKETS